MIDATLIQSKKLNLVKESSTVVYSGFGPDQG